MIRLALLAVAFLAVSSAHAQVHKCVDAAGKTIYTQDPCPANTKSGTMSRSVIPAPAMAPQAAPADQAAKGAKGDAAKKSGPKTAAEQEQDFRKRSRVREREGRKPNKNRGE